MTELGNIRVKVEADGVEDAASQMQDIQADPEGMVAPTQVTGGEAAAMGGMMGGIMGMVMSSMGKSVEGILNTVKAIATIAMAIGGSVAGIAGMVLSMEAVQNMLDAIMDVFQAFFVPFLKMALRLMAPVLRGLIKLLPAWFDFMESMDPYLDELVKSFFTALGYLFSIGRSAKGFIDKVSDLNSMILGFIAAVMPVLRTIRDAVKDFVTDPLDRIPGGGRIAEFQEGRSPLAPLGGGVGILIDEIRRISTPNVTLEGGLGALVNRAYLDKNSRGL